MIPTPSQLIKLADNSPTLSLSPVQDNYASIKPDKQKFTYPSMLPQSDETRSPLFLEKSYQPHYQAWKDDPNPKTTGNMLNVVAPVINEAIRTYGGGAIGSPTLKSKAKKLTIHAIQNYDPTKAKLRTHLLAQLQGLRRMAAKEEQVLNIPEQVLLDLGNLRESENRLRDRLGRDPSDVELSDHTGLSDKRLAYLRTMKPSFAEGRLVRVDEEGSGMSTPSIQTSRGQLKSWHKFVYHDLDPIDQQIMEHTLGMNNKKVLSNQEMAEKLRLSPGAVSQRKAKIQNKLDQIDLTGLF